MAVVVNQHIFYFGRFARKMMGKEGVFLFRILGEFLLSSLEVCILKDSHFEIENLLVFMRTVRMLSEYKYDHEKWLRKTKGCF